MKMNKIQILSKTVRIFIVMYGLVLLLSNVTWLFAGPDFFKKPAIEQNTSTHSVWIRSVPIPLSQKSLAQTPFTLQMKWSTFLSGLLSDAPLLVGLFLLHNIFLNYSKGNIFTQKNIRYYQYCGMLLMINEIIFSPMKNGWGALQDQYQRFSVGFSHHEHILFSMDDFRMSYVMIGLMIIIVSWVMAEAVKLHEDHSLIV